jgi:hypothetical protein
MKPGDPIEFGVTKVEQSEDHFILEGRCQMGPILPGQTFTSISEMTVHLAPDACGPTTLRRLASAELRIEAIWAYGRQIDELSRSMTARIIVKGECGISIRPGLVLS